MSLIRSCSVLLPTQRSAYGRYAGTAAVLFTVLPEKELTGKNTELDISAEKFLEQCRLYTDLPLALGFGLSQREDLRQLHGKAEIAIVGSALLKTWEAEGETGYRKHLMSLAAARE